VVLVLSDAIEGSIETFSFSTMENKRLTMRCKKGLSGNGMTVTKPLWNWRRKEPKRKESTKMLQWELYSLPRFI
jgi:hypothetical protein